MLGGERVAIPTGSGGRQSGRARTGPNGDGTPGWGVALAVGAKVSGRVVDWVLERGQDGHSRKGRVFLFVFLEIFVQSIRWGVLLVLTPTCIGCP